MSNETFEDRELTCKDCKQPWIWEAGEQKFFAEKDFSTPKRCIPCRKARRAQRDGEPAPDPEGGNW